MASRQSSLRGFMTGVITPRPPSRSAFATMRFSEVLDLALATPPDASPDTDMIAALLLKMAFMKRVIDYSVVGRMVEFFCRKEILEEMIRLCASDAAETELKYRLLLRTPEDKESCMLFGDLIWESFRDFPIHFSALTLLTCAQFPKILEGVADHANIIGTLLIFFEQPPPLDSISAFTVASILLELLRRRFDDVMTAVMSRGAKLISGLLANSSHEKVTLVLRKIIMSKDPQILETCARVKIFLNRAAHFRLLTEIVAADPDDVESMGELTSVGRLVAMCGADISSFAVHPAAPECVKSMSLIENALPLAKMLECSLDCYLTGNIPQPLIVTMKVIDGIILASVKMDEEARVAAREVFFEQLSPLFGRLGKAMAQAKCNGEVQILMLSFFALCFECNGNETTEALYKQKVPRTLISCLEKQKTKASNIVARGITNCVVVAFREPFTGTMVKAWFEGTDLPSIILQSERHITEISRTLPEEYLSQILTLSYSLTVRSLAASLYRSRVFDSKVFSTVTASGGGSNSAANRRAQLTSICRRAAAMHVEEESLRLMFDEAFIDRAVPKRRSLSPPPFASTERAQMPVRSG
mmetsp:Transcript_21618/g.57698  ORF Transcript_21618/g.57698 Transcript_21618/m.57698 type:complete len:587 (+) Transcript_21618:2-1762(+)